MFSFACTFEPDMEGGYVVSCRDIPELHTQGDSLEEARTMALDALITSMDFYFEDQRPVPVATPPRKGEEVVELPLSIAAKVLLLNQMIDKRVRPSDLAKAMDVRPQEVTRIMDIHHSTKIDTLSDAFRALGKRLDFQLA